MPICQQGNQMSNFFESISDDVLSELRLCYEKTEGMISFDEGLTLYSLAKKAETGCIIEVGSYRGRSSVFLAKGSEAGEGLPVYAVDPHESFIGVLGGVFGPVDRKAFYKTMLETGCSEIVSLINLSSDKFAMNWDKPVSVLWIDGDHSYEGVLADFENWSPHLADKASIAFDDATDPNLGPFKLIDELLSSGKFIKVNAVGKVVILEPTSK